MDGNDQPHVHLMFNERLQDGIERDQNNISNAITVKILNVAELKGQYRQELPGTKN